MRRLLVAAVAVALLASCGASPEPQPDPWAGFPAVEGPDPSTQVAAFYYPWYGNPDTDGRWIHWDQNGKVPPNDLGTDYYPQLGAYSSNDPAVIGQHMAWLRAAGVGVIVVSWHFAAPSEASPLTDEQFDRIFDVAEHYGIEVTFQIEPNNRTFDGARDAIIHLLDRYEDHPALYRYQGESPWLPGVAARPLVFMWATNLEGDGPDPVPMSSWAPVLDAVHEATDAFVVDCPCGGRFAESVLDGHFDGASNYATTGGVADGPFDWARTLPAKALYVPSIIPGMSQDACCDGGPEAFFDRADGAYYREQFEAATTAGVQPALLTITSFNEWHEGTQIEPADPTHADASAGRPWLDYGALGADGYLTLTAELVERYATIDWTEQAGGTPIRLIVDSSSDFAVVGLLTGRFARPQLVERSEEALTATSDIIDGVYSLFLTQDLARAEGGGSVRTVYEILLSELPIGGLEIRIERGAIGQTTATFQVFRDGAWVEVDSFRFDSRTSTTGTYTVPSDRFA